MRKRRYIYAGLVGLVILCLILGTGAFTFYRRLPPVSNQLAAAEDTTVVIINPASGGNYPADAAIPITVLAASSQPVTTVELWADGNLFKSQTPGADDNPAFFYATLTWMPLTEGEHLLVARAVNQDGSIGTSNILRIKADPAAGYLLRHTSQTGETWDSLTQVCDTSLEMIGAQNPDLDPDEPLPAGETVDIPCGTLFPTSAETDGNVTQPLGQVGESDPGSAPGQVEFWLNDLFTPELQGPSAPGLTAGLDGCTVQLLVQDNSDNELGFEIRRSGPNGFSPIATVGANDGASFVYEDPLTQNGQVQYIVNVFNASGKQSSPIVAVDIPDGSCTEADSDQLSYSDGILTMPPEINIAYIYASLDNGPWQRLPTGDDFINPTNGQVNMNSYINQLLKAVPGAHIAKLKVWGWSGSVLRDLGSLTITLDRTELTFCNLDDPSRDCLGDVGSNHWVTSGEVPSNALNSERTFHYMANNPDIAYMLVQVSARPFGQAFQVEDPYLVDAFVIPVEDQGESVVDGKFVLNFSNYQHPESTAQNGIAVYSNTYATEALSPYDQSLIDQMKSSGVGSYLLEGIENPTYYIRVIPWDYDKPMGALSNTVDLIYKPRQPNPPYSIQSTSTPAYELEIIGYSPEIKVNPDNFGCVTITGIDEATLRDDLKDYFPVPGGSSLQWEIDNAVANYQTIMNTGDKICPPPIPYVKDTLGDILTRVWNEMVALWEDIKATVVNVVVDGLNGVFGEDFCNQVCKDGLLLGLNMAVTYFTGIPPTLPSANELLTDGFSYAISVGLSQAGISCDSLCTEAVDEASQTMADALLKAKSQPGCSSAAASQYLKQALCLPAGLTVQPISGAVYSPAFITLQATRTVSGSQMSAAQSDYSVLVNTTVRNDAVVGQTNNYGGPNWWAGDTHNTLVFPYTISEPLEGNPFQTASIILPDTLLTGMQLTIPVTLPPFVDEQENVTDGAYIYWPLLNEAASQAQAMNMPSGLSDWLWDAAARYSTYRLLSPGHSITIQAQLLCYDVAAMGKIPCTDTVTRTFTAEEVQAIYDQLNEVQP